MFFSPAAGGVGAGSAGRREIRRRAQRGLQGAGGMQPARVDGAGSAGGGVLLLVLVAEQSTGGVREEKGGGMNWNDTAGRGSAGAG